MPQMTRENSLASQNKIETSVAVPVIWKGHRAGKGKSKKNEVISLSKTYSQERNSDILFLHLEFTNKVHDKIIIIQLFCSISWSNL